jgi:RND family efflux transporter MFP subunit
MPFPSFLKKKRTWVIVVAVLLVSGFVYGKSQAPKGPFYDTQPVTEGALKQTVEATGQVVPQARLDLSFKNGGKITALPASVGARVKKGDILGEVDRSEADLNVRRAAAGVSLALANLRSREAGETAETIRIAQASLDQAKANQQKAQSDLEATRRAVEDEYQVATIALDTAQRNFDNTGNSNDQTVTNGYVSLKNSLQNALGPIQTGLTDGDLLVGVDNQSENWRYSLTFGAGDSTSLQNAKAQYPLAKTAREAAFNSVRLLPAMATNAQIRESAELVKDALEKTQRYLDFVQRALTATTASASFTASEIASKKATIDADRAAVGTQLTTVSTALQTAVNTELARTTSIDQLRNALETAKANLRIAETNRVSKVRAAESAVQIQTAAVASAQAGLDQRKAPPRAVDLAALRAQLRDAETAYTQATQRLDDTRIIAPVDGVIAEVVPKVGEQAMLGAKVIGMIAEAKYTIEALIPESDIAKVTTDQMATITLDAFGDAQPFTGFVTAEYPDQTKVQDAVYYKAIVGIDTQGKDVKPGMTADVTILTAERASSTLSIPTRAVRQVDGQPTVQVLVNGKAEDRAITTGLRADEARVEVLSGLKLGEQVIVGELTAQEYTARQKTNQP